MLNSKASTFVRAAGLLLLGTLAACGGGGGGGGGGAASGGGGAPAGGGGGSTSPLVYTGNSNPAVITATNAAQLAASIVGGVETSSAFLSSASGSHSNGARDVTRRLGSAFRATPLRPRSSAGQAVSAAIDDIEPCDDGGFVQLVGDTGPSGTGTVNVTWSSCRTGDSTLNGTGSAKIDVLSADVLDLTFSFQRLTLSNPGDSTELSGSVRLQQSTTGNSEITTLNVVTLDTGGRMMKTEDFKVTDVFDSLSAPTSFSEVISGRLFDGVLGSVEILTTTPFVFQTLLQEFPASGRLFLTGANNARIRAAALSPIALELALDLDNNNVFETVALLAWTDLSGPVGADIGDSDNDRMHNGWETAHGLNPSDPADASGDLDRDGATNLEEYLAGTNPNDRNSLPPVPPLPGEPVRIIPMPGTIDLVFDSFSQTMFASVRGAPGSAGSVVPINPATGAVGNPIPVGIDPQKLALSDDGKYLYVAIDESAVQRIDLSTRRVDLKFSLGASSRCPTPAPLFVQDMQVVPGKPQAIVIARVNTCLSPSHEGVALYVNGVQQGAVLLDRSEASNVIEFSASSGTLYGLTTEISSLAFRTMAVSLDAGSGLGVTEVSVFTRFDGDVFPSNTRDMLFAGGRIYLPGGRIIDPQIPTVVGEFQLGFWFDTLVRPDHALGRVFFLVDRNGSPVGLPRPWTLLAFEANTQVPLGEQQIPDVLENAGTLIRWGAKGLAFRTFRQGVFLIQPPASLIP